MKIALIILCILGQNCYIYFSSKKNYFLGLCAKTIASICFVMLGYKAYFMVNDMSNKWFLIGLILDGVGDVFLGIRNIFAKEKMFLVGTISFLIGHIFTIIGIMPRLYQYRILIISIGIIIGTLAYLQFVNVCHFNKTLKFVGYFYIVMILSIGVYGVCGFVLSRTFKNAVFMAGSLLFMVSDIILVFYNFGERKKGMHEVYSACYYMGQIAIALSMGL